MSAPQIPNLLSMRRGGSRARGGDRGGSSSRGGFMRPPPPGFSSGSEQTPSQHDSIIQQTDSDALQSRISAVNAGYFDDKYARPFSIGEPSRKLPIINRGTYVRTKSIDSLVVAFLKATPGPKQIVSLGAGTDTRYWRLMERDLASNLFYHEIDFPTVSEKKLAAVRSSKQLSPLESPFMTLHKDGVCPDPDKRGWGFKKSEPLVEGFLFHPLDLRKIKENSVIAWPPSRIPPIHDLIDPQMALPSSDPSTLLPASFGAIKKNLPTLLISECCLCYLDKEAADGVIKWFMKRCPELGIILYEPTSPNDEFGEMMFKNLSMRNISMPTVHAYPTLSSQKQRLVSLGFSTSQEAADIDFLWEHWVPDEERDRVNRLEGLDEVEEWELLSRHYSVVYGYLQHTKGKRCFSRAWRFQASMGLDRRPGDHYNYDPDGDDEGYGEESRIDDDARFMMADGLAFEGDDYEM